MKLQPLNNYVILENIKPEEKTISGIILPCPVDKNIEKSRIIGHAPACLQVENDDIVIHRPNAATEFEFEGQNLLAINERDLICKIIQ